MRYFLIFCAGLWLLPLTQHVANAAASHPHRAQWVHFENAESRAVRDRIYKQRGTDSVSIPVYAQPDRTSSIVGYLELVFEYYNIESDSWLYKITNGYFRFGYQEEGVYFVQKDKRIPIGPGYHEAIGRIRYPFLKQQGTWFLLPPNPYPQSVWVELEPGPDGHNIRITQFEPGAYHMGMRRCEATQSLRDCWPPEMVDVIRSDHKGVFYYPTDAPNIECDFYDYKEKKQPPCRCTQRPCPSPKFIPWDKVFDKNGVSILDPQVGC